MFSGTRYETRTCPRRHLRRNPELVEAQSLYSLTPEGAPGIDGLAGLSGRGADALSVIGDARAWRMRDEFEQETARLKRGG